MKIKLLFIVAILSVACKNEEKTNQKPENTLEKSLIEEKLPNKLIFEVDLTTSHPDVFKLFANNVFLNNDQSMSLSVAHQLNSYETSKKITFEFPQGIKPDVQLGFNLGVKAEKEIQIKSMSLSYGSTKFSITTETLNDYFTFNKFVKIDIETNTIITKKVENRHNPMLLIRRKILDSIQNVY